MELNNPGGSRQQPYSGGSRMDDQALFQEIVFSTRIRLSRNIPELPFSHLFTRSEFDELKAVAENYVREYSEDNLSLVDLTALSPADKRYLREKNLITSAMEQSAASMLIKQADERYSILVNDGDHFKIQVIRPGLMISDAFRAADEVDEKLNRVTPYSFDSALGYLSPEISNIGTSMKISFLLHLPALSFSGRINLAAEEVKREEIYLTGVSDGAGKNRGSLYLLYTGRTLGVSEIDLIEMADASVNRVIAMEDEERDSIYSASRIELEDRIMRSLGILKHAITISYAEALSLVSNVRLGVVLSIVRGITLKELNIIMTGIQPRHLQKFFERSIDSAEDSNILRSEYLKKVLERTG